MNSFSNPLIQRFISVLDVDRVLTGEALRQRYHHIWKMEEGLSAKAVLLPRNTQEISKILKICHAENQTVVVHGGLTNLVGSTETMATDVVVSMEKMNVIEEVDESSRTMTVQAGVILANAQQAAADKDLLFPLNFGAKGTAQIGGAISTNAGGLRVLKYGMTRQLIVGLEAVLADETIISSLKKIIKDNSGYDLKQLFIGAEGSLGIVTRAVLKLVEKPQSRSSAFVGLNDFGQVVKFLKFMDKGLAGNLSAFELIWKHTFMAMTGPTASVTSPLSYDYQFYVLLESLGSDAENDQLQLQNLLEEAMEKSLILDAVMAHSQSDLDWFWKIREEVSVLSKLCHHDQHFDVSIPIPQIGIYVEEVLADLKAIPEVEDAFAFGHVADGNIHFVVGKKEEAPALVKAINDVVYRSIKARGGSVSAEHGIGLYKKEYLSLCRSPEEIRLMKTLKQCLDPKGILNSKIIF